MRGLDTNVLLRFFIADNPVQAEAVKRSFKETQARGERLFISTVVLCEALWTLRGKPYKFNRVSLALMVETLLRNALFEIQDRDLVQKALQDYRNGRADFADYLLGWENREAGCRDTLTFDGPLSRHEGFFLLS
jgi:predicted nucleic-acid-binding protein